MKPFRLNRRFTKLVILAVSLILIVGLARSSYGLWKKKDIVAERQTVLTELETENAALKQQLEEAKSEGFIERVAREKLGLVKEGETLVIIKNEKLKMKNEEQGTEENVPNWKKWWGLFF